MTDTRPWELLIVDPDAAAAQKLISALGPVATARIYKTAAEITTPAGDATPRVIVAGLTVPATVASDALRLLCKRWPHATGVIVSTYQDYTQIDSAVRSADSFLLVCRPYEDSKLMEQVDRAAKAARLRAQMTSMRISTRGTAAV
jgi:DNA-binding NarL/FixJ family response regulator